MKDCRRNIRETVRGLYAIVDYGLTRQGITQDITALLAAGVRSIQYRHKNSNPSVVYEQALQVRRIVRTAALIINDYPDIAVAVDADGVHVGAGDMPPEQARTIVGPERVIGVTVRSPADARRAQKAGADYLGVGPVYATRTKQIAVEPLGVETVQAICAVVDIPVIAIGGITVENAGPVVTAGAAGVCAISALLAAPDMTRQAMAFQRLFFKDEGAD